MSSGETASSRVAHPVVRNDLSGVVQGQIVQAASIGQVHFHDSHRYPVPSQLPPPPSFFTSRGSELADLQRWLGESDDRPLFAVISGPGGVGKSTLALRWMHDVRQHFPDGQLYVNLGAFSGGGPVSPEEVLEWFLLALGVTPERIPTGLSQRTALYRSVTADRLVAVLLDDAVSAAQVRPLLPASSRSAVLVTSRWRLVGLRMAGARFVEVDPLDVADSVALLNRVVGGDRLTREHQHAEELAQLCGGMPIALSVMGARLLAHPNRPLAREVGDLRGRDRLATLSIGADHSVAAAFDMSYEELPAQEALAYRRCALHPGSSFGVAVAAVATGLSVDGTEQVLDALVERNLLTEVADRRFRYHDLLLVHARQLAETVGDEVGEPAQAMVEWYLELAVGADLVLRPTRRRIGPRFDAGRSRPAEFADRSSALCWLEEERANLTQSARTANERGWYDLVWQFCEALWGFFLYAPHYDDWLDLHRIGIPAAQHLGHRAAEARLRTQLGYALVKLGRYEEAKQENETALELAEADGDEFTIAAALSELAGAVRGTGDLVGALAHLRRARAIREVIGTPRAVALCDRGIGETLAELGRFDDAVLALSEAASAMERLGDPAQHARALTSLGSTHAMCGRPDDADTALTRALALTDSLGSRHYRAEVLAVLGEVAVRAGRPDAARIHLAEAFQIYDDSGDPKAEAIAGLLADLVDARPRRSDSSEP